MHAVPGASTARRIVVGHSQTGEIDKIDGPYYFFTLIKKMRKALPQWMPTLGIEGGRINIVPVDFVVDAMDHIAHKQGLDGRCFHLTDPEPRRIGEMLNIFARPPTRPEMTMRLDARMFGVRARLRASTRRCRSPPVRRIQKHVLADLRIPKDMLKFITYPTRFDNRECAKALKGTGIAVPAPRGLRLAPVGLLGAPPRSRPVHRPLARAARWRTRWW